jgi:hypothetical protein
MQIRVINGTDARILVARVERCILMEHTYSPIALRICNISYIIGYDVHYVTADTSPILIATSQ